MRKYPIICRMCIKPSTINDHNSFHEVLNEVFRDILTEAEDVVEVDHPRFCDKCSVILEMALTFKSECAAAEEFLFPYLTAKKGRAINLTEIYCETNNVTDRNLKVCRICLKDSKNCNPFNLPLGTTEDQNMLEKYLPNLIEDNIEDAFICDLCSINLTWFLSLISDCLKTEKKLNEYLNGNKDNDKEYLEKLFENNLSKKKSINIRNDSLVKRPIMNGKRKRDVMRKQFRCSTCNKKFAHKCSLQDHQKISHGKIEYHYCKECDYKTNRKASLRRHMYTHVDKSQLECFKCEKCSFSTTNKRGLYSHSKIHSDPSEIKMNHCHLCSYSSISKQHVKRHVTNIHKDISEVETFNCNQCDYRCREKSNLKIHMCKHATKKSFKCPHCDFKTKYDYSLKLHINNHNYSGPLFKCEKCDYSSKLKSNLRAHIRHIHDKKITEHVCNICGFKTSRKGCLIHHIKIHSNKFEFQCKYCDFETKYKASIARHSRVFHNKNENNQINK